MTHLANRFGPTPGEPKSQMAAMSAFFDGYFRFSGRASRSEYWYAILFVFIVSLFLSVLDTTDVIYSIWALVILVPSLALACRRLHDINRSGWWQLLMFIPLLGHIVLIVFYCTGPRGSAQAVPQPVFGRNDPIPSTAERMAQDATPRPTSVPGVSRPASAPPSVSRQAAPRDAIEALERLVKLRDAGALSNEEFEAEKRRILSRD